MKGEGMADTKGREGVVTYRTTGGELELAVKESPECGCQVFGDGTLGSPLRVEFCPLHGAATAMLDALERVNADMSSVDSDVPPLTVGTVRAVRLATEAATA